MQPYFFPYIGYFQLMAAVDLFIVYDNAQFMKGGWVNRNRILHNGAPSWWTYAVQREDHQLPIHLRQYSANRETTQRLHAQLEAAYRNAPYYKEVHSWLHQIWPDTTNIAAFNEHMLSAVAAKLDLTCKFARASSFDVGSIKAEAKIIALSEAVGATTYVNASGGKALYDRDHFAERGITLEFLDAIMPAYPQFDAPPVLGLSIVDVLMFQGFTAAGCLARDYAFATHD